MKVLLVCPEIRLDSKPFDFPFWAGIFASIVESRGGQVAILDLNALRMNYGGNLVPSEIIKNEISMAKWDLIGIGGLTTTYARMKQLIPFIRKYCPDSTIIAGGGWVTYNADDIYQLIPEIDLIAIGEGEETFTEVYDEIDRGNHGWEPDDPLELIQSHGHNANLQMLDKNDPKFKKLYPTVFNPDFKTYCILDPIFQYYSQALKEFISRSPSSVTTINCTEGGSIFGDKIQSMNFEQFLSKYSK